MSVFLIERRYAAQLELDAELASRINRINDEEGVRWLSSFLAADRRKTFCLYEADDIPSLRRAADRAGLPADAIVELTGRVMPDGELAPL
jgi:hypothetical protein